MEHSRFVNTQWYGHCGIPVSHTSAFTTPCSVNILFKILQNGKISWYKGTRYNFIIVIKSQKGTVART